MSTGHQESLPVDVSADHLTQAAARLERRQMEFFASEMTKWPLPSGRANQAVLDAMNMAGIKYLEALNSNRGSEREHS